jgi:steroid 5-alpha reductase family enzyme
MTEIAPALMMNAAVMAALFTLLWLVSIPLKDPSFIDSWWALGIVVLAWLSFVQAPAPGAHAWALAALASVWGLRLGLYLFWRWRKHGADRRYVSILGQARVKRGWNYALSSLLLVFALQFPLQFVVALPVQLGVLAPGSIFGLLAWLGVALALAGIAIEAVADWQLTQFKADQANTGKVMDRGLWRYSRHPNHFGDACAWWGMYAIAADTGLGAWSLPGPILLTFLLTRVSGAPTIEPHMKRQRPDYEAYVRRTSAFVPWPPRQSSTPR